MRYALRCLQLIYSALCHASLLHNKQSERGKKTHPTFTCREANRENRSLLGSNNLHFLTAALCDERKGKRSKWRRGQSPSKAGAPLGAGGAAVRPSVPGSASLQKERCCFTMSFAVGGRLLRLYVRNAIPSTHKALVLLSRMENTSVFTRERFAVFKEAYCFSSA